MNWLKRIIYRWSQDGRELSEDDHPMLAGSTKSNRRVLKTSDVDADDGLNITVRKAIGGKIITFRHYDNKTDRSNYKLYVVPDELDFDKELGKMITLESMRM